MLEYQRQKGLLLAVKGLNCVCWMSCRVLQTLKLSMAKIMGSGNVGRERRSVVRMMANLCAGYEPLMGDVLQMVMGGALLNVAAEPEGLSFFSVIRTVRVAYSGCRIGEKSLSEVVTTPEVEVVQFLWGYVVHQSELEK